jgi:hypothetical protein
MSDQMNIPSHPEDHDCFKRMALKLGYKMKEFFHQLVKAEMDNPRIEKKEKV